MLNARQLLASVSWTAGATILRSMFALAGFVVMTQLLPPEAFGIGALLGATVALCEAVLGYQSLEALVQRRTLSEAHRSTMFWLFLSAALCALGVAILAAPAFASFYREPALVSLLPLAMLAPVFSAAGAVFYATLVREMRFAELALAMAVAETVGVAVGLGFAFAGFGATALVITILATSFMRFTAFAVLSSWRPRLLFRLSAARELFGFNMAIIALRLTGSADNALPGLIVGRVLGTTALGHFSVGKRIVELVTETVAQPVQTVALPVASKLQTSRATLAAYYGAALQFCAAIAAPIFFGIILTADRFLPMVFGDTWAPSVPVVIVLALLGLRTALGVVNGTVLRGIGRPGLALVSQLIRLGMTVSLALLLSGYGIVGVAAGIALAAYLHWPIAIAFLAHASGISAGQQLRPLALPFLASGAMVTAVLLLDWSGVLSGMPRAELAAMVAGGAAVYVTLAWLTMGRTLRALLAAERDAPPLRTAEAG